MRTTGLVLGAAALLLAGCTSEPEADVPDWSPRTTSEAPGDTSPTRSTKQPAHEPEWHVETLADGFDHPWSVRVLTDGAVLFTERSGDISLLADGEVSRIVEGPEDLVAQGEGGLMGLELAPSFERNGRFLACYATTRGDVEVWAWRLAEDRGSATREDEALVSGLTLNPSGRHSGCSLRLGGDGMLYVGAGDSAVGTNPQDMSALGGKVLRVDPRTGEAPDDNPFADEEDPETRLVWTYGHRNVQGLALQPGTGDLFSAEHGPDIDDEVNRLEAGANYGWDPVGSGTYDESVPMTDTEKFPAAVKAVWSSGDPTLAISGIDFVDGEEWGSAEGLLAIAALKASTLYLLDVETGDLSKVHNLAGTHGRLRAVELGPDGALYVTTDNGGDDEILRVTP